MMRTPTAQGTAPRSAVALSPQVALRDEARALLDDGSTPREFFERLVEARHYCDAIRWLPHLLPKRAAVWWGCLCAWEVYRPNPPAVVDAALQAAMRWVVEPTEENRYAAKSPGRAARCASIAGALAIAAHHSGGSLLPPNLPTLPPKPWRTARLVGLSVYLASCTFPHPRYDAVRRQFLELGRDIAERRNTWLPEGTPAVARCAIEPMVARQMPPRRRRKRSVAVA